MHNVGGRWKRCPCLNQGKTCCACDNACENEAVVLGKYVFGVFDIEKCQKNQFLFERKGIAREYQETCKLVVEPLTAGYFWHQKSCLKNLKIGCLTVFSNNELSLLKKALTASVPCCIQIRCACSRYRRVIGSLARRNIGSLANCNCSGTNCSKPCDLRIPLLSKYGFRDRILHLESSLRPY